MLGRNRVVPKCDASVGHMSFNSIEGLASVQSMGGKTTATQETALASNRNNNKRHNHTYRRKKNKQSSTRNIDGVDDDEQSLLHASLLSGVKISSSSHVIEVESTMPSNSTAPLSSKKAWKGIKKRIMGSTKNNNKHSDSKQSFFNRERTRTVETVSSAATNDSPPLSQSRSRSFQQIGRSITGIYGRRRRCRTSNHKECIDLDEDIKKHQAAEQAIIDDAIRGRLDGMDVLSLGPCRMRSIPFSDAMPSSSSLSDFITQPISRKTLKYLPSQMVSQMIWTSAGHEVPEMFLEGFAPDDRWMVCMDEVKVPSSITGATKGSKNNKNTSSSSGSSVTTRTTAPLSAASTFDSEKTSDKISMTSHCIDMFQCNHPCGGQAVSIDEEEDEHPIPARLLEQNIWGSSPVPPTHLSRTTVQEDNIKDNDNVDNDDDNRFISCFGGHYCVDYDSDDTLNQNSNNIDNVHNTEDCYEDDDEGDDDDIMNLAASMSVPVDIDEDALIVETPSHLQALHDIASLPLRQGKYKKAISIFNKILKGLQQRANDNKEMINRVRSRSPSKNTAGSNNNNNVTPLQQARINENLIGSTYHNIATIHMWAGNYQDALDNFEQATIYRKRILPKNHCDVAVSLVRQGIAHFALCDYSIAIDCYKNALEICTYENMTRAKILNNIGVAYYQQKDLTKSLDYLTNALEIQRTMLDSPIKRDTIVYDASITLGNMGKIYVEREDYELALYLYEEALLLQTAAFSKDSKLVLLSLSNLAYTKALNGQFKESIQTYKSLLRLQEVKHGMDSEEYIETSGLIGRLYVQIAQEQKQCQDVNSTINSKSSDYNVNEATKYLKIVSTWQSRNNYAHSSSTDRRLQYTKDTLKQVEECGAVKKNLTGWV